MAEINQGIINYGSIGGNASVHIVQHQKDLSALSAQLAGSDADPSLAKQLTSLIADLQMALSAVPGNQAGSADAVAKAVKQAVQDAMGKGQEAPDKKVVEISAKGLIEAAEGLVGVMPIAAKIAALVTGAFGFL